MVAHAVSLQAASELLCALTSGALHGLVAGSVHEEDELIARVFALDRWRERARETKTRFEYYLCPGPNKRERREIGAFDKSLCGMVSLLPP